MNLRLDAHTVISLSPTALPGVSAPTGSVFRGLNDLDDAKAYADRVCAWFSDNNAPTHVFVVRGPTSTTKLAYEVVDATAGYSIVHRAMPPAPEVAIEAAVDAARAAGLPELTLSEKMVAGDRAKTRFEAEGVHHACLMDVLSGRSGIVRETSLARCHDFVARQVACLNPTLRGRDGSHEALTVNFLAHPWEAQYVDELDDLFRRYIRAGHAVLDRALSQMSAEGTFVESPSALEYAVRQGKTRLMVAMLDEGIDPSVAPAEDYGRVAGDPPLAKAGDLLTFISEQGHTDVDGMLAAAKEAIMRAQIKRSVPPAEVAGSAVEPPRRRSRMV